MPDPRFDLVIRNGRILTPLDIFEADIGISDGTIQCLSTALQGEGREEIDASNFLVMPGLVDTDVRFQFEQFGSASADDAASATRAAALGGVTTVVDTAVQAPGGTLAGALKDRRDEVAGALNVDCTLQPLITEWNEATRREIRDLVAEGTPSFGVDGPLLGDAGILLELFQETSRVGGTVVVQPDDPQVAERLARPLRREGRTGMEYGASVHSPHGEALAVETAVTLAGMTRGNLHLQRVTTAEGLAAAWAGRCRGVNVSVGTALPYVTLRSPEQPSPLHWCQPPLRSSHDVEVLWNGLAGGQIEVLSSGHRNFPARDKQKAASDFSRIPQGIPGIDVLLPLILHHGVRGNRISLKQVVQLLATNPALILGLFPAKGRLQIGSDADLVLIDTEREAVLKTGRHPAGADHSPYEGQTVRGIAVATILRGNVLVRKGEFVADSPLGKLITRQPLEENY